MKVLFITPYLPSETSGHAGAQLIFRNVTSLTKKHDVTIASFLDKNEKEMICSLTDIGINVHTIDYPRNESSIKGKIESGIRNMGPIASYLKGNEPFFFAKYNKKKMAELIKNLITQNSFDLVQVEYNVMHHYRNLFQNIPSIIVFHDVSTKMYESGQASGEKSNMRSFKLAQKVEADIANKFDAVVTLTEADKTYLDQLGCEKNIYVIPPQIKLPTSIELEKDAGSICFLGSFNREPNIKAVEVLIDQIYPNLNSDIILNIAGKGLPKSLQSKIDQLDRIQYLEFVEDIDAFLSSQLLMVAPIEIGAGLKMKIPHALSCGTAVLTTDVGAEGIPVSEWEGMFVSNIEDMPEQINELIMEMDNDYLHSLALKGQIAVKLLFNESVIMSKFDELYRSLVLG